MDKEQYYIGIKFYNNTFNYFFMTEDPSIKKGDNVVVETSRGLEVGVVSFDPISISTYKHSFELKPILRKADANDMMVHKANIERDKEVITTAKKFVKELNLDMHILNAVFSLDGTKLTITFVSDDRVDFRELVKMLASKYRCRIELKQIGPRDKAKTNGGIGVCGLPICCSNFLNEIETISINKAKNQMLSLNISKLSGPCGKLLCCLSYEDESYTNEKKKFPPLGETISIDGVIFKVNSFNIFSKDIKIENADEVRIISLEEYQKIKRGNHKDNK